MSTRKLLLLTLPICLALSVATTLATFNIRHENTRVVDTAHIYHGWPLPWMTELIPLWDYWPPSIRATTYSFHLLNFVADTLFWATVYLLPLILFIFARNAHKRKAT